MTTREHRRVAVIGGGHAGSTAATLLAKAGFDTVLFEKAKSPRYHIGESLPVTVRPFLDLLAGERWEVERAKFDNMLLPDAERHGVRVREQVDVTKVCFDGERAVALQWESAFGERGETGFDMLVDASGRRGVLTTSHFNSRKFMDAFQSVAIWAYWKNARLRPDCELSWISVDDGWFWAIPINPTTMSVGLVWSSTRLSLRS